MSGVQMHMTNTRNAPIEVFEASHPMFVEHYGLVPESEGAGKFRGGFGKRRDITILSSENTITTSTDRTRIPPWGLYGGASGGTSKFLLTNPSDTVIQLPSKGTRRVDEGYRLSCITAGGGGYGNPLERDPFRVRWDVVEGLIGRERARDVYGVVIGENYQIDDAATAELRRKKMATAQPEPVPAAGSPPRS
jgi:N-methylhydantoinase B